MKIINNPQRSQWKDLLQRPYVDNSAIVATVQNILSDVREMGDSAIRLLSKKIDGFDLDAIEVSDAEITAAERQISAALKKGIQQAKINIDKFHTAQQTKLEIIETMPGIQCWRKQVGIEKVGLYIPAGTAPLFSTVLMLGIPARLAGCKEIILCSPCNKNKEIHPAILYAAKIVGVTKIFKIGGAQAIAAMGYGTETVPQVYKIFGPGNQYVTAAKQLIQMSGVAIDMPAGPSEVCVVADETANASFAASDLLSQAEHGPDSQVLLISTSSEFVEKVLFEISRQLTVLPRKDFAKKVLENSKAIIVNKVSDAMEIVNEYAPEHLIICTQLADAMAEEVINAGSVFIGNYSTESAGDYASGTNHTLPTNGFAKMNSGVSIDSFVKKITFQKISKAGLNTIAETVITMAEAEGLQAHANAVKIRY